MLSRQRPSVEAELVLYSSLQTFWTQNISFALAQIDEHLLVAREHFD
jgi:hypothetical protein